MSRRFYFGLNINRSLSEIQDKEQALFNLNLNKLDLDVLFGLRNIGITSNDLRVLSSLDLDFLKELYALNTNSYALTKLFSDINTIDTGIESNIQLNGRYSAKSFKFDYLDFSTNTIKGADVSTSRVSSWSTFEEPPIANTPIFYGGTLEVIPETNSSIVEIGNVEILSPPEERRFSGESPTHLISLTINGNVEKFYAMKSIPLKFEGFFRNANLIFTFTQFDSEVRPSIVIKNKNLNTEFVDAERDYDYELRYRDNLSYPREIEIYYPPNEILSIDLQRLNISRIPEEILTNLTNLDLSENSIRDLPNFSVITPSLQYLNLSNNELNSNSKSKLESLPNSLINLILNETIRFNDELDFSYLSNLQTLRIRRNNLEANNSPRINSDSIKTYDIFDNNFKNVEDSVLDSESLEYLNIRSNKIDNNITISSENLRTYVSGGGGNEHNIVDVSGKKDLVFYIDVNRNNIKNNKSIDGIFDQCSALRTINIDSNFQATGDITTALSNKNLTNLERFQARRTDIYGKLANNSFKDCESLRSLLLQESRIGLDSSGSQYQNFFDENCFDNTKIETISIRLNENVKGSLPNFGNVPTLKRLILSDLGIESGLGTFINNTNFNLLIVRNCNLNQSIPNFKARKLSRIDLSQNNISGFIPQFDLPNLRVLELNANLITQTIPNFIDCPQLEVLNLQDNQIERYESNAFLSNFKLRQLNLSNNSLSRIAIENIINDLYDNYQKLPRTNVTVNFIGNGVTIDDLGITYLNKITFLRNNGWRIFI